MTDSPGVPPALGIEAVEWLAEGGENLTVRVTGRWRRRRPTWSGQPLLVIEAQGRRHRFPAMPEPPSLSGTAPGTWRMSFSVPASLAPHIGSRGWLQLGAVVVPLPIEVRAGSPVTTEPGVVATGQPQSTELAVQAARRRAAEAEETAAELALRVEQLERELGQARAESARPESVQSDAQRAVLAAEQREHAERTRREELQDELTRRIREHEHAHGRAARRIAELESDAASLRRRRDEAEQEAAAARCARAHAEQELAETRRALRSGLGRGDALRAEQELSARTPRDVRTAPPDPPPAADGMRLLGAEQRLVTARSALATDAIVEELRRELAAGAAVEETLRAAADRERSARADAEAEVARLERELRESTSRSTRVHEAIEELRGELKAVRETVNMSAAPPDPPPPDDPDPPAGPPVVAEDPASDSPVVGEDPASDSPVVGEDPASDPPQARPDTPAGPVDGARLEAALARLREANPEAAPTAQAGVAAGRPWLEPVFRTLAKRDPAAAGRLTVALLPAQPLVHPRPLAYDLVLAELGCVAVTSADGAARVEVRDAPRPREQTQLMITGEVAGLGRLIGSRRVRRRARRGGRARAKGERAALRALRALVRAPLGVEQLHAAGVRPEPSLVMLLASMMIRPEWTSGEDFMIAHQDPEASAPGAALRVCDKAPVSVGDAAELRPAGTTVLCPGGSLLAVLAGAEAPDVTVEGDERPLAVLRSWLERAQSG